MFCGIKALKTLIANNEQNTITFYYCLVLCFMFKS